MSAQRSPGPEVAGVVSGDSPTQRWDLRTHPDRPRPWAPSMVALGATPRVSSRCSWQVVEGEAVLLDLEGKRILGLNRAGSWVFPLLDGSRTVAGLAVSLAERFGIELNRAEADLRAFLVELASRGFVEGVER